MIKEEQIEEMATIYTGKGRRSIKKKKRLVKSKRIWNI